MEVHKELGSGFLEAVYQDALEVEFRSRSIYFSREHKISVMYKGIQLGTPYYADFLCFSSVIVELKAIKRLTEREDSQIIRYLNATGMNRGLLINFAARSLEYRRFANSLRKSSSSKIHSEIVR